MGLRFAASRLLAIAVVGAAALLAASLPPPPADPMVYFQALMPVLTHPRCVNCHGGTDPISGRNHGGGAVDLSEIQCSNCHDDAWGDQVAPADLSFVGKDADALCAQMARHVMLAGVGDFFHHIQEDDPIKLAFVGRMANARDATLRPAPPPMTHRRFLDVTADWLNAGNGGCLEEGRIRRRQRIFNEETKQIAPGHVQSIQVTRTHEVIVELRDGKYSAHAELTGSFVVRQEMQQGTCASTIVSNATYTGESDGPATVETRVAPDGRYTIAVSGPPETFRQLTNGQSTNSCGLQNMVEEPREIELHWPAWTFSIEGSLVNPQDRRRLVGVTQDAVVGSRRTREQKAFLSVSDQNGKPIPISVRTDWNLLYGR